MMTMMTATETLKKSLATLGLAYSETAQHLISTCIHNRLPFYTGSRMVNIK